MKKNDLWLYLSALTLFLAAMSFAQTSPRARWEPTKDWFEEARIYERPKTGYVGNKEAAIAIGRAVILSAYRKTFAEGLETEDVKLFGDVWVVYSYLPQNPAPLGGVTTVEISKTSGPS